MTITLPSGSTFKLEFDFRDAPGTKAIASITLPNGEIWNCAAVSSCDSRDQYTRAGGRRAALRRLLTPNRFSRETRAVIWAAYFSRHNDLHARADRQLKRSLEYAKQKLVYAMSAGTVPPTTSAIFNL